MKKIFALFVIFVLTVSETFAYAVKVYDEYGNRLGTYRREGENFVLYDFYDKKVEQPDDLIKNAPNKQTLSDTSQYFYNENLIPIGSFNTGLWDGYGRYYPRGYRYNNYYRHGSGNYIVRPSARGMFPPPPPPRRAPAVYTNITNYALPNFSAIPKFKL